MAGRRFVPFGDLWDMRIDVPYSFLVVDGDHAWSCGQLALDPGGTVLHPGDLAAQSTVVAENLTEILRRAELDPAAIGELLLYHAPATPDSVEEMLATFRSVAPDAVLTPFEVPHFYYDGVELEVDLSWGREPIDWPAPTVAEIDGVRVETSRTGRFTQVAARVVAGTEGLVPQTEAVMATLDAHLPTIGLGYGDVVKSTTHYVAGDSAAELHDNMAVRNRRYTSPGPASTGVPVAGFDDPACRIAVTLTLATD